jgi:hypothetical protein
MYDIQQNIGKKPCFCNWVIFSPICEWVKDNLRPQADRVCVSAAPGCVINTYCSQYNNQYLCMSVRCRHECIGPIVCVCVSASARSCVWVQDVGMSASAWVHRHECKMSAWVHRHECIGMSAINTYCNQYNTLSLTQYNNQYFCLNTVNSKGGRGGPTAVVGHVGVGFTNEIFLFLK